MSACRILPFEINSQPTSRRTLAELYDRIDGKLTATIKEVARQKNAKVREGDSAAFEERSALRTAFRHLTTMCNNRPLELIDVDEIVEFTTEDFEQTLGTSHRNAIKMGWARTKLLKYAAVGDWWTCEAWQRREAWLPIRRALEVALDKNGRVKKGRSSAGCQGIVTFAERNGWWPDTFSQETMNAWIAWMLDEERDSSVRTVEIEESQFRTKLRRAGLQHLIPNYRLDFRRGTDYRLSLDDPKFADLLQEILGIIDWKLNKCPRKFRLRQVSADGLLHILLELCGYAVYERGICGISSLHQVITQEIIGAFLLWAQQDRKRFPYSIRLALGRICGLINQGCPPFTGNKEEYGWFRLTLQRMPREDKNELRERKNKKSRPYSDLAKIGRKLLADFKRTEAVDPMKAARLFHDYTFVEALRRHPWRLRNWSSARGENDPRPNIKLMEIPRRVRRDGKLPSSVKRALKLDPHAEFLVAHFIETETKNNHEVFEILDPALVKTFEKFGAQRRIIVGDGPDPTTFFLNNSKKGPGAMSENAMANLLAKLSVRYLGLENRLSFHICRDIVTEHKLVHGATFEDIQRALWHVLAKSTQTYLSGINASHGTVVLEKEFIKRPGGRK
jgi:hypothetical protein